MVEIPRGVSSVKGPSVRVAAKPWDLILPVYVVSAHSVRKAHFFLFLFAQCLHIKADSPGRTTKAWFPNAIPCLETPSGHMVVV